MKKVINFLLKYCLIITSIIIGILGICSIFITAYFKTSYNSAPEMTYFKFSYVLPEVLLSILLSLIIILIYKKVLKRVNNIFFIIPISLLIFIAYIFWISVIKLKPIDDQLRIHEIAISFLDSGIDFHLGFHQYLFLYPYQLGLIYLVAQLYKIFGENFTVIQYFNAICSIANFYLLYIISKKIFKSENVQKYLIIFLGLFSLYWMFFNVYFYGNIVGLTFALISILFTLIYLEKNKLYCLLIAGLSIGLSILLKTNYSIFLCGIIIVLTLDMLKDWNKKKLLFIPILLIGYLIVNLSYNLVIDKKYNIKLPEGVPMINFIYMGISSNDNDLFPGWYNGETINIYFRNNCNTESNNKETKELIGKRLEYFLKNPSEFLSYFSQKIGSTWLNPTFQTIFCSTIGQRFNWDGDYAVYIDHHQMIISMVASNGDLYKLEENYFNIYQIIVFIFGAIGIFLLGKNNNFTIEQTLLPIIFLGGFVFHIIWETKAIYVIQYYYLLLPFASYGFYIISEKIIYLIFKKKELNP